MNYIKAPCPFLVLSLSCPFGASSYISIHCDMGGAGPYVRYDTSDLNLASWAETTGLKRLSLQELDAAWERARPWVLENKDWLVDAYGWSALSEDQNTLFALTRVHHHMYLRRFVQTSLRLSLPIRSSLLVDNENALPWKKMFEQSLVFNAASDPGDSSVGLYIDSPEPLRDIFYLLQVLAPGLLVIARIHELDENRDSITARVLPIPEWVRGNEASLKVILGSGVAYEEVIAACENSERAQKVKTVSYALGEDGEESLPRSEENKEESSSAPVDSAGALPRPEWVREYEPSFIMKEILDNAVTYDGFLATREENERARKVKAVSGELSAPGSQENREGPSLPPAGKAVTHDLEEGLLGLDLDESLPDPKEDGEGSPGWDGEESPHELWDDIPPWEPEESYFDSFRPRYNRSRSESPRDYTACDKECGYCGRCDYNDPDDY